MTTGNPRLVSCLYFEYSLPTSPSRSSFAHGVSPNITNRQYDVPVPTLRDLTHEGQSEEGLKASECFIHLCTLSVILGEVLPLVYDLEQRDIWRDIRRRETELDIWEQDVSLPINGPNEKYPYPISGLSSLCLSYLSVRLLLCRIAFRVSVADLWLRKQANDVRLRTRLALRIWIGPLICGIILGDFAARLKISLNISAL
jgi:hypothetical protein